MRVDLAEARLQVLTGSYANRHSPLFARCRRFFPHPFPSIFFSPMVGRFVSEESKRPAAGLSSGAGLRQKICGFRSPSDDLPRHPPAGDIRDNRII
ncbi:MAG: hypothetical protein C6P37_16190 [Caldibacillus debilis]|uniref:Uncharacterized protein n=1 Tax=Caldibacillus debilis TaxID=301148 RepID=A0A3E0JW03_9BACI|nr:MAG: hypothetical protein C6P37_16190 [Caldibacillus debilis]